MLEQLNRIELTGKVGSVNLQEIGDVKSAKFSIATSVAYKSRNGEPVIETTWLSAICFEGNGFDDLAGLHKGSIVHLTGRFRNTSYTDTF
ncbi:MAG: single-stranded DNA-binding protein, partial [Bacteroidales bacterium]|nr:single-stranded DNA-binding protein [Bacteroidales bacterium]